MLRHARPAPERFVELAGDLFEVMATGGRVGFETVAWFNGGLFDDSTALALEKSDLETVLAASDLDWSEIDPSILGTLFERGPDPGKRAQLGAHYTDRDKIMLLVEPVVIRPLKRLLARLELIEATGVLEIDMAWVNGNYQRVLFHSVRTASADRVREMAAPRRHLALVCFLHQAWRDTLDQAVDMYGKLLDRNRKLVEDRLDHMLKVQRHAVDRIVDRYRRLRRGTARSRRRRR